MQKLQFQETITADVEGFKHPVSATISVKSVYTIHDLRSMANQVMNGGYCDRSVDRWAVSADIVDGRSARKATYERNDLHWFLVYLGFKLNSGREQANPSYRRYVKKMETLTYA